MSSLHLVPSNIPHDDESDTQHSALSTQHSALSDRRSHKRFLVTRPGKVFRRASQQYLPVTSCDLSFGGALLDVESERSFTIGEVIDVGLALSKKAIVPAASLLSGIVVRSEAIGQHRQLVAVRYLHREAMSVAA